MIKKLQNYFIDKKLTLSLAESCTGGEIAAKITKFSGASNYFLGGFITYSNKMKSDILGVDPKLIEEKSAVCSQVVYQMCLAALKLSGSDYAIAVTGYADKDNAGLVFGAIGTKNKIYTGKIAGLNGLERNALQKKCAEFLLESLYNFVTKNEVPFAHK